MDHLPEFPRDPKARTWSFTCSCGIIRAGFNSLASARRAFHSHVRTWGNL